MKKTYYLFNPGRLSRTDNTLKFIPTDSNGNEGTPKYIPIEGVADLFCFGSLDANSALYTFLGKAGIAVHFFDYYEHYAGSFMPKEYLLAGKMQIEQTKSYIDKKKRLELARKFVSGASFNMVKNLRYYINRERDLQNVQDSIEKYNLLIDTSTEVDELMGVEGNIRQMYYSAFNEIIIPDFTMGNRSKRPPENEINALISFGNMLCYTLCLGQIYHTQLNPTISFLHEPGYRRYSLALDLAEIFKPLLVDRLIFRLLNKKEIQAKDFDHQLNSCILTESGRKIFVKAWEEKITETFKHPVLKRNISYKHLIKLECYKLSKHILDIEEYKPFKSRW
ncbi:type I-B CRISPR-associated endonuclease Cas1b [Myroides sp. M-43]|uniref:type I-B CRISPR-associated endonuclease Cas1b n=1 Tax=Myroides oncorhynchi TaxID=2893756 RepID=UPI001E47B39E|nr:type I-B CRISPR-associated endonuclease Cas1b [Myroides oncorhynchi]MCC9043501.1 type I-B CRISPR-associated endonuclease Cas1b [Myroides oncorhynchi]